MKEPVFMMNIPKHIVFQVLSPIIFQIVLIGASIKTVGDQSEDSTLTTSSVESSNQADQADVIPSNSASDRTLVDANTLRRKVLCGYQGWFRCPGDPAKIGWRHWSRNAKRFSPDDATFEMWPDLNEYDADEKYPAPGFTHPDGSQAYLFSSANEKTVKRHFELMKRYDIDGVFLQRFLVELHNPSIDLVLNHVRKSAQATGRVFAICYDLSGTPSDQIVKTIADDWKKLVDVLKIHQDKQYLHDQNKPVVFVWGFYPDRFNARVANQVIDFFTTEGPYQATLIGGCPWYWRNEKDPEWRRVYRRFNVISPWNVGNYMTINGRRQAATNSWKDDLITTKQAGSTFMPVIYPGFGWTNLKGKTAAGAAIPRLRGDFFKRQFQTAAELGVQVIYVAMFDEFDEGTAILPVDSIPPVQGRFSTFEGLPPDAYLKLTHEGSQLIRRARSR